MEKISFDLDQEKELGMHWDAENDIRMNFGHKRRNVCLFQRGGVGM